MAAIDSNEITDIPTVLVNETKLGAGNNGNSPKNSPVLNRRISKQLMTPTASSDRGVYIQHRSQFQHRRNSAQQNLAMVADDEDERLKQQQFILSMLSQPSTRHGSVMRPTSIESHFLPLSDVENTSNGTNKCCEIFLFILSIIIFILTFPFAFCFSLRVVQEYERAVVFRLGHLVSRKPQGPGMIFILPCIDKYVLIDLRTHTHDVEPQEVLTNDSVTVTVDAVVYYRVVDPILAVVRVADYEKSIDLVSASLLRNVLGTRTLTELLSERDSVSRNMQSLLDEITENWGVKVERVEIKNVQLPIQLQRAMATEAEAAREALARVIAAEGEQKASHALKTAADVINDSPGAMQLRYLQTLTAISSEKNSTIIFPVSFILPFFSKLFPDF